MVCVGGDFANCKIEELHQGKCKLNQIGYHSILLLHAIPSETQLVDQGFVCMQDNDPKHTSKLCQRYIKSKEEVMSLPVQSADLNPIELVWDELDRKVRTKQPTRAAHLWQLLLESWAELSSVYFQPLVEKMLRICETVIADKEGHFM